MAIPPGVLTTQVTFGPAGTVGLGRDLAMRVSFTPSRSAVWAATGAPLIGITEVAEADAGQQGQVTLINPDQVGFIDGNGAAVRGWTIRAVAEYLDEGGRKVGVGSTVFTLTAADVDQTVDLDTMIPVTSSAGVVVLIPDQWSANLDEAAELVDLATQLAADAVPLEQKGAPSGVATLTSAGKVPEAQIPTRLSSAAITTIDEKASAAIPAAQKGVASGVATLGSDSKLPDSQVPARLGATELAATILDTAGSKFALLKRGGAYVSALTSRETARFVAWVVGDSNTENYGNVTRWLDVLANAFAAAYPTTGVAGRGKYIPVRYENTGKPTPWTITKPAEVVFDTTGKYGFAGRSMTLPKFAADSSTITMSIVVDQGGAGYIMHPTGVGGGGYEVRVNGTLVQTQATPSATDGEGRSSAFTLVAGDSVEVRAQASGVPAKINGLLIIPSVAAKGITFIDAGHAGWSAVDYAAAQVTARPTLKYLASIGTELNPDLVLIPLSVNDWMLRKTPVQYAAALQSLIAGIRQGVNGTATTFVVITHVNTGIISDPAAPWEDYVAAARAVADGDTGLGGQSAVLHIDLGDFIYDSAATNAPGYFGSDLVHFSVLGNLIVAKGLLERLVF